MNVSIGDRWQGLLSNLVQDGRYQSESDALSEALHLLAQREAQFQELRTSIQKAIAGGRVCTEEELDAALEAAEARLRLEGYPE